MSVENPNNKILSFGEYRRVLRKASKNPTKFRDLVFSKLTQSESQKITRYDTNGNKHDGSIEKVLKVLDEYGKLKTSDVQKKSGLHSKSVQRALRLLEEKKIVKLERLP